MKTAKLSAWAFSALLRLALIVTMFGAWIAHAAIEQTFDVLQIGSTTYRNVTVTTKSREYIFILHSRGMTNLKVGDLPSDLRAKLGYADPAAQPKANPTSAWARQTISKIEAPQVKQIEQSLLEWSRSGAARVGLNVPSLDQKDLLLMFAGFLALYLFHCYLCLQICVKSGSKPGVLVWLPFLQLIPLLKAASMPRGWILVFLVPGLNLVAQVLLCIKLTQARGKGLGVALLLIFPLSSPFAAVYLAFSGGQPASRDDRRIEIMTLETA